MIFRRPSIATVSLNVRPRPGPYGGANQWAWQLTRSLRRAGYRVVFDLRPTVDIVMGTHLGLSGHLAFSWEEIAAAKARNPHLRVIQRINDNDVRKSTGSMNNVLAAANKVADHTVFVSAWLRDHHTANWFDTTRRHSVIVPGADPAVFHPLGNRPWQEGETFRIVTHHWSDNPSKGFDVYRAIDEAIASGHLSGCELRIIGRWPREIIWRAAKTFHTASGHALAELLRQCHLYVSASRYEPGAMHPVEGVQCGLPLLYHRDSGGTVELGGRFGILLTEDITASVLEARHQYKELRIAVLSDPPSGDLMDLQYRRLIQSQITSEQNSPV